MRVDRIGELGCTVTDAATVLTLDGEPLHEALGRVFWWLGGGQVERVRLMIDDVPVGEPGVTLDDANRTLDGAILGALVQSADRTGLRAGPATSTLIQQIKNAVLGPEVEWAVRMVHLDRSRLPTPPLQPERQAAEPEAVGEA